jgi:hypothetical protein
MPWCTHVQVRRQHRPKYLGGIDGLLVGAVPEQGYPEFNGDAAKCGNLVSAGATSVQAALGGVVQLLQGEKTKALDKCSFHLQDNGDCGDCFSLPKDRDCYPQWTQSPTCSEAWKEANTAFNCLTGSCPRPRIT